MPHHPTGRCQQVTIVARAAVCLAGLLVAAPAARAQVEVARAEPQRVRVELAGVDGPLADNVRAVLSLAREAEDGELPPERIRRLHERAESEIRLALEPFGLYRPVIRRSLIREGDEWVARYEIRPGPAVRVRRLELAIEGEGAETPVFRKAVEEFPLREGDTLLHAAYETAKLQWLTLASDSGYLAAAFDTSAILVDRGAAAADVVLRFDTGPRFRFGPVTFDQNILDPKLLQTRVPFRQGDYFRQDKLLELQAILAEDPYFSRIEVIPHPENASNGEVPIEVDLVPRRPRAYEAGVGYASDMGPRAQATARWVRLNRRGHNAEIEVNASPIEQNGSLRYSIPSIGSPRGVLTLIGGYARLEPVHASSETFRLGALLSRDRYRLKETLSLAFQHETFEVGRDTATSDLLIAGGNWELTKADTRLFPSRGYRARVFLQGSARGVLANASFLQTQLTGELIRSLAERTRVLVRADVGRIFTGEFRRLPPSIRFFTGGDQSVRGYRYLSLGTLDESGNTIGGRILVGGSLEVDHRFLEDWALAAFVDAGNALERFSLALVERAVGLGVRWLSPVGPVRVDGAWAVTQPGTPFRVHLWMGPDL